MRKIILIIPVLFLMNTLMAQRSKLNIGVEFSYDKVLGQRLLLSGSGDRDLFLSGSDFNYSLAITNTQFITEQVQFKSGIMYADRDAIGVINCNRCEANTDPLPIIFQ